MRSWKRALRRFGGFVAAAAVLMLVPARAASDQPRAVTVTIPASPGRFEILAAQRSETAEHLLREGAWHLIEGGRFRIYYQELTQKDLVPGLEAAYQRILEDLDADDTVRWTEPCEIFILPGLTSWNRFFRDTQENHPLLFRGFMVPKEREIFLTRFGRIALPTTLAHELTHLITWQLINGAALPLWLSEGIAEHESREPTTYLALRGHLANGTLIPLDELLARTGYPQEEQKLRLFYLQSRSLADFLLRAGGRTRFSRLLRATGSSGFLAALKERYPAFETTSDLESAWHVFLLDQKPGRASSF